MRLYLIEWHSYFIHVGQPNILIINVREFENCLRISLVYLTHEFRTFIKKTENVLINLINKRYK